MTTDTQITTIKSLPTPKGHMLLGHLPQFQTPNKHQVLERWVEECGELFRINFVGKELLVSANAAVNSKILKERPDTFKRLSKMNEILVEMGIDGVFNAEGDSWRRHRKPVAEALNAQKIKGFHHVLVNKTQSLLQKFEEYATTKKVVDIRKDFMCFTIDITTAIAFGYEIDTIHTNESDFQKHLEVIFPMINERITAPIPLWRYIKQKKDKKLEEAIQSIETIIHRFINETRQKLEENPLLKKQPSNFLEALLTEEGGAQFSDEEIYGNIFTMLLAGEDTTSNTISWIIYYLSQNSEMVNTIRQEAIEVYGENEVSKTTQELVKLTYTNAVVQEAIRLKPTTPQLYLEANEEVVVEGLLIPKGTKIIIQNKVAQTQEKYFTDADQFMPERWIKSKCPMHQQHSPEVVKAFGGGARFCPGKYLAINEMLILVSAICKNFNITLAVAPKEVTEQFEFTMYPDNLKVQFTKRN